MWKPGIARFQERSKVTIGFMGVDEVNRLAFACDLILIRRIEHHNESTDKVERTIIES